MTERDADGKFMATGMNKMILDSLANKPGARLMRRLIDADAARRKQEAQ